MGVVFDEVVGNVEPAETPAPPEDKQEPAPAESSPARIRRELHRLEQRAARLHAD